MSETGTAALKIPSIMMEWDEFIALPVAWGDEAALAMAAAGGAFKYVCPTGQWLVIDVNGNTFLPEVKDLVVCGRNVRG